MLGSSSGSLNSSPVACDKPSSPHPRSPPSARPQSTSANKSTTRSRGPLAEVIGAQFPAFDCESAVIFPFQDETARDEAFQKELNEMLLDAALQTHAWASARPFHETDMATRKYEQQIMTLQAQENEQGMRRPLAPTSSSGHIRKSTSSSFLSLRQKTKTSPVGSPYEPTGSRSNYFDAYPRAGSSRSSKPKSRDPLPSSKPTSPTLPAVEASPIAFPTIDLPPEPTYPSAGLPQRSRSYTGPSGHERYSRTDLGAVPDLRFSGSSTQHTETPPDTPIDSFDSSSFTDFDFAVVVSAPVSGVETMDALVDGMNGGDEIIGRGSTFSSRQRFGIPNHHPLYEPPLPTPPPGIVLGGPKHRRQKRESFSSNSGSEDEEARRQALAASRPRRRRTRPSPTRNASNSTITPAKPVPQVPIEDESSFTAFPSVETTPRKAGYTAGYVPSDKQRTVAPSISDIIRTHAPQQAQVRSRPSITTRTSVYSQSHGGHSTVHEESEPEPIAPDEADIISRSSVDSIADEVRRTLNQISLKPTPALPPPSSFLRRHSAFSDNASIISPRSDGGAGSSLYAPSIRSNHQPTSPIDPNFLSLTRPTASQAVAQYLRSARLTTLLKCTRSPHASPDNPLTVSLSDLGSPTGFPVLVFLGLGCVRHVMGLYDDMAACLGLRLITIDRWGLGRTEARSKSSKGIMQWASVVEEILDLLDIGECSVMAHSAGTPYALSFANKLPERIRGNICLLAPWVGGSENGGYKWLKYVPNGILKTAQAAEWKVQAWMIGKPPTIAYEGIGYTLTRSPKAPAQKATSPQSSYRNLGVYASINDAEGRPRPSFGSNFSEYDDLRDFDGRFESKSTLGSAPRPRKDSKAAKRKPSRGFLDRLTKGPQPPSPEDPKPTPVQTGKKLKGLRSMGSLRKASNSQAAAKRSEPSSPQLPPTPKFDVGLGFDNVGWTKAGVSETSLLPDTGEGNGLRSASEKFYTTPSRAQGRRSMSFTSPPKTWSPQSTPSSPAASSYNTSSTSVFAPPSTEKPNGEYQSALGNALIAASHAESSKGMHNDLLQILNHDNHPWGFSYSHYPHEVNVWYGDKDEKIAENAVRWMEKNMGDKCTIKVVKGADHALMYKSSVVVEVLEQLLGYWQPEN
ncbi:hypothetical protein MVEN_01904700 [Mycena venus]|uniref:Alpha/beta-hydrolase n=1 Tax=Mycena venus TaxID=2733690 RepID=A0A8H6XG29_9AGAR|nr:hypothetical protein MVEN_01904700 [Mycena venus]